MTIKKLTVAAAIAVGIATCSLNQAMAACPCNQTPIAPAPCAEPLPVVTGPACPCETRAPKCNRCQKTFDECDCKKKDPCEKKDPCKKDPCKKKKSDCGCPEEVSCDGPPTPAAAVCPGAGKPARQDMLQVYGYPNAIYGANNYVGEPAASIANIDTPCATALCAPCSACGTGAACAAGAPCGCNQRSISSMPLGSGTTVSSRGEATGAAAQLPCLNTAPTRCNGIPIDRNERLMDNNNCPIDFQSSNSLDAVRKSFVPFTYKEHCEGASMIGAAAGLPTGNCNFPDVPQSFWAACDIDKLAINCVVVGYPDGYFKPNRDITRAEFATMLVKGFNLNCDMQREGLFKDVPRSNWANAAIAKAVDENLLAGYPNGTFKPNAHVTRVEALSTIAKGMTCDIDEYKANEILGKYADGGSVPNWARIPVAKSLQSGALKDMPNPNMIQPNKEASRAEVSSMLQTVRVALGYDTNPRTANNICPACPIEKSAFMEQEEIVKIPTLKLAMMDQITSKSSHTGQYFRAKTLEDVAINGVSYPCGSTVTGQVVEVIRPSGCDKGALKLSFTEIKNGDCKTNLPKQILQAQINKSKNVNPVARLVEAPFTLAGSLVGTVGRTAGGIVTNLGNAVENVSNDAGYMLGHVFQGEFGAAARNLGDGLWETVKAPIDVTRTALSGTMGLFQTTGDEIAYLVDPRGYKISAVNPREHVTIAFGCAE